MAEYISFQPSDYFNTKLWTGTGSSNAITGVGFQPDFSWVKQRSGTENHFLQDAVRGSTTVIQSDTTAAEQTASNGMTSFDSDGFTVGTDSGWNGNTSTYVGWNWKAGTSTGIDLTAGTITPSAYSISTTAGISILKYAGTGTASQTIAHGLGSVPKFMIFKKTSATAAWIVYHDYTGPTKALFLNGSDAQSTGLSYFQNTAPTSTLISTGAVGELNGTNICYCFAEKQGFSKFGGYTGNGNADGPFIYTGFRPAWYMYKRTDSADSWNLVDSKRVGYNPDNNRLFPHSISTEDTQDRVDLVSNGIKIRTSDTGTNNSSGTYIYMAFAEFPIVSSNDVPGTAR